MPSPTNYRLLNQGEQILPGDEYWNQLDQAWIPATGVTAGSIVGANSSPFRRPSPLITEVVAALAPFVDLADAVSATEGYFIFARGDAEINSEDLMRVVDLFDSLTKSKLSA